MPFIREDTYSNQNPSMLYAKAGTEVVVLSGDKGALIVKPVNGGNPFYVCAWEVTDDKRICGRGASFAEMRDSMPVRSVTTVSPTSPETISPGTLAYLSKQVYSMLNPSNVYGEQDEAVTVISERAGTYVVARVRDGFRFPVIDKDLKDVCSTIQSTGKDQVSRVEEKPPPAIRRPQRSKPAARPDPAIISAQQSLF